MTVDPRIERFLPRVLEDMGSGGKPAYTERLLERTARTRQRPAWSFFERWFLMDVTAARPRAVPSRWRLLAVATLLLIALFVLAIAAGVGSGPRIPLPFGVARNGLIAFTANGDIFATDPATNDSTGLIVGPTFDSRAGYSPDGSMVGFLRRADPTIDGPTDLMVAQSDGSRVRTISDVPLEAAPTLWQWSSDAKSIVLITADGTYATFDATQRGAARVVNTGGVVIESPVFQPPTGKRVLFRGRTTDGIGVFVMDADGTNLQPLIPPAQSVPDGDLGGLAWSPDGRQISYHHIPPTGTSQRIFVMNADGTGAHVVADTAGDLWDGYPQWSPDGSRIAFGRYDAGSDTYRTAILRVADGTVRTIGPPIGSDVSSVGYWSPDGKGFLIVYSSGTGRTPVMLDPEGGPDRPVSWPAEAPIDWQRLAP